MRPSDILCCLGCTTRRQRQHRQDVAAAQEIATTVPNHDWCGTNAANAYPHDHEARIPYALRAELDSPGIKDSTCRVDGDIHDSKLLPVLPADYKSLYSVINDGENMVDSTQEQSPFFTRLPPELRQLIYRHLFGDRRIHLDYDFVLGHNRWSWWHRVCDDAENCPDKNLTCPETAHAEFAMQRLGWGSWLKKNFEYRVLALGWLRSCKLGYQESLPVLYGTNKFVLTQGIDQVLRLTRIMPRDHLSLLTTLSVEITLYRICGTPPPDMKADFEEYYRRFFEILERDLPNVRSLSLSLTSMPRPQIPPVEWSEEHDERWLGPWECLGKSRSWLQLEVAVPDYWFEIFQERARGRRERYGKEKYTLIKGIDPFQKGW